MTPDFVRPALAAFALVLGLAAPPAPAADDFSPAERALFITNHLATVRPPATLRYRFAKSGSLEPGFDDGVVLRLKARPDRSCCSADADFLSGPRRVELPGVESAEGNPVLLYFLERDIREMNRRTKGQAAYFRKRIRMAVYQGATMRETTASYAGRTVPAREFTVTPYVDDPLRARFENLAPKRYVFTLSDAVPGGIVALRTEVDGATADAPLLREVLTLEGAAPAPRQP